MIKTILVPVSGAMDVDDVTFAASVWVARLFSDHIDFLYARPDPVGATTQAAAFLGGAIVSPAMIKHLEAAVATSEERAFERYRSVCETEQIATDVISVGTRTSRRPGCAKPDA